VEGLVSCHTQALIAIDVLFHHIIVVVRREISDQSSVVKP
jgi:hypothetical protein